MPPPSSLSEPSSINSPLLIRPVREDDFAAWLPLWAGYNEFYGRVGTTALPQAINTLTWQRFFQDHEPMFALVAQRDGQLLGLAHYLLHRSTTRLEPVCYLSDLYTAASARGQGIGGALIQGVYAAAGALGARRVYWQTHSGNQAGRRLYDKLAQHLGFIVYSHEGA